MSVQLSRDQVVACVKRLPVLPRAVQELADALRRDDLQVERIVGIVSSDQALMLAALRLANSSFYGVSGRIASLRDAIQILGIHTLSSAVMTAAVMSSFDPSSCAGFDFQGCWQHAIATAVCAQRLAQARGLDADEAYTVGLLHDIGRLALASHFPTQFAASLAWGSEHRQSPIQSERSVLGIEHAEVGSLIAEHWRLAPGIVDAIRLHHELPSHYAGGVLDVLHLADSIAHALDLSNELDELVPPLWSGAWERVAPSAPELQELFRHVEVRVEQLGSFGR